MKNIHMNEFEVSQQDIDQMVRKAFVLCMNMIITGNAINFYFPDHSSIRYYDPGTGYREVMHCPKRFNANCTVFYTEYEPAFSFDIWEQ